MRRIVTERKKVLPTDSLPAVKIEITRREWFILIVVLAAGIGVRMFALSRSAVEHFDEGVYASNIYFGPPEYAYPMQRFYAPPLLPALIEAGMIGGLPANLAELLPSFLAGCGTIGALWWFGRSWFGPGAGLAAAALVSLNDFHILLSTAALTDALLGLWLVLAVDAIARSLLAGDLRWAIGAGLYTGLAWWTKYNGWLPLAIEAAALPVLCFIVRPIRNMLLRWLSCFAVTALVAAAAWSPFYLSLQPLGGYGPIAANHAKYVVGLAGWFDAALRQIANQYMIDTPLSGIAVVLAVLLPGLLVDESGWRRLWRAGIALGAGILAIFCTSALVLAVGTVAGIARSIVVLYKQAQSNGSTPRWVVGFSLVAAWWIGLFIATPLYTPYPRLVLPWLVAAWLGMSLNWTGFPRKEGGELKGSIGPRLKTLVVYAALAGLFLVPAFFLLHHDYPLTGGRRGIANIARLIRETNDGRQRVIYIFGEPALYFQLRTAGENFAIPVQNLPTTSATFEGRAVPTFLVAGPHSNRDPNFREQLAAAGNRWKLVQSYDYVPSKLVWLDLHDPRRAAGQQGADDAVRLYELEL